MVTTWMGDCLLTGKSSQYVPNHLGQLSLPSLRGNLIEYHSLMLTFPHVVQQKIPWLLPLNAFYGSKTTIKRTGRGSALDPAGKATVLPETSSYFEGGRFAVGKGTGESRGKEGRGTEGKGREGAREEGMEGRRRDGGKKKGRQGRREGWGKGKGRGGKGREGFVIPCLDAWRRLWVYVRSSYN